MRGNEHQKICELVDDYIDGNLNTNDNKIFETHLKKCSKCHNYVEKYREIQTFITQKKAVCIPDDADMRIRMSLRTEINENTSDKNVLDIEDVAQLLNITVSDVVDMLDELPAFEISGRIRFRRQSIELPRAKCQAGYQRKT